MAYIQYSVIFSEGLQQHRIHTVNPTGPVGVHGVIKKGDYLIEVIFIPLTKYRLEFEDTL